MPNRFISATSAVGMALGLVALTAPPVTGQVANTVTNDAARSDLPRTPDGHPDLQGTYDLATMTPFERLPGDPPFLTKEKAVVLERAEARRRSKDDEPSPADRPPPPVGGDTSAPKSFFEALEKAGGGAVGGYNRFWLNQGSAYTEVGGRFEHPSSLCGEARGRRRRLLQPFLAQPGLGIHRSRWAGSNIHDPPGGHGLPRDPQ